MAMSPELVALPISEDALKELVSNGRLRKQFAFILEVEKLKTILRRTPLLDTSRPENDAEHTWELALMAIVLSEYSDTVVDVLRVLKMLLIHDIVEIDAGDTFIYDDQAQLDQAEREKLAADRIFGLLPQDQAQEFRALWDEFEERQTAEAKFARAMDRLQPLLHNYFTSGGTWHTPGVTADDVTRRKSPIADSSAALWDAAKELIAAGVGRGYLRPGTKA